MKAGEFAGSCQYPILDSLVVRIPACHAGGRGSIPRQGEHFLRPKKVKLLSKFCQVDEKL